MRDYWAPQSAELVAERDRYREAMQQADEELALIADDASEDIGMRIDSVRASLKDALPPRQP